MDSWSWKIMEFPKIWHLTCHNWIKYWPMTKNNTTNCEYSARTICWSLSSTTLRLETPKGVAPSLVRAKVAKHRIRARVKSCQIGPTVTSDLRFIESLRRLSRQNLKKTHNQSGPQNIHLPERALWKLSWRTSPKRNCCQTGPSTTSYYWSGSKQPERAQLCAFTLRSAVSVRQTRAAEQGCLHLRRCRHLFLPSCSWVEPPQSGCHRDRIHYLKKRLSSQMWFEVNVRLSEVTDLKWPHRAERQCANSTLAMSWPNHVQILSFASMASSQVAIKHGFVSKIVGGCSSYDVIAPWPDLVNFFLPKVAQGLPHKVPRNYAPPFFAICEKPQGVYQPPCPGEG